MKKSLRLILVIFLILFWLMRAWNETEPEPEIVYFEDYDELCEEFIDDNGLLSTDPHRLIQRSWMAYKDDNSYCASYAAQQQIFEEASAFHNGLKINYDGNYVRFWNSLYSSLYNHDGGSLSFLQDSLLSLSNIKNLTQIDFASLVVSFVQDIPYEYVKTGPCDGPEDTPCNGNVSYGIYSPAEFVYALKGDCDTRTLLLFTLLENLGFDAVIMNSYEYEHSMLGINLPLVGDNISYLGRNYYFWETTAMGWLPGELPPDMSNTDYWKVVLD